jgi:hypothetical protein
MRGVYSAVIQALPFISLILSWLKDIQHHDGIRDPYRGHVAHAAVASICTSEVLPCLYTAGHVRSDLHCDIHPAPDEQLLEISSVPGQETTLKVLFPSKASMSPCSRLVLA